MDFFAHQEAARKRTALLLFYYVLAVISLILIPYFAYTLFVNWYGFGPESKASYWHPSELFWISGFTLFVIALGTIWRRMDLRDGGRAVAEMLGGRRLDLFPRDELEKRLRNVVEEMAIASQVPVPEIYVMEDEGGINAFAAGYSHGDMVVAVTRGCLNRLTRDELQGVIAHEFSHILNGDMRLNIWLLSVLNGILCLYLLGRILFSHIGSVRTSDRDKGVGAVILGVMLVSVILVIVGALGVLFARLIQAAVSRQREYLADASAVQFTRNPEGIAGALRKIGGSSSQMRSPQAAAASHFFFCNGLAASWFELLATHPPLAKRIQRINPNFREVFPPLDRPARQTASASESASPLIRPDLAELAARTMPVEKIVRQMGQPASVGYAAGVIDSLPPELVEAAHEPLNASTLIFAMVLHGTESVRMRQLERLSDLDTTTAHLTECNWLYLNGMDDLRARLPLVNLSLPALRTLSRPQWEQFRSMLEELINFDKQVDLFEFTLRRIIERNIDANWQPKKAATVQFYSFTALTPDYAVLLSALAHLGNTDPAAVRRALGTGLACLPADIEVSLIPAENCGIQEIDRALTRLGAAVPHIKRVVLEACARTVACDGIVRSEEAELLRAIAESLEFPIPPFVEGA
jgi:Zn-dependent protease with chaperone function